ncbi:uncharacterized protein BJ171DRAFT_522870 [Polychytrium aggregatum]|uniref:uncharacterized protein n=1 Tax=Polychytrium aggregatum TaxID=110093 RepID=UPI0022FDB259|nr:uncharacterized protein BJ171DRAFT_522870 [Polychytrium aggregatum]KAI9197146.1 hypothetical protein BJ171DRAFT_522870 [Polychytrium aggregatum]
MPEMPKLTTLILPPLIRSLQWMLRILYSLQSIDLSRCSELASLKEIPYLPNLRKLITPKGLKTLDIPLDHISSLEELHMSYSSSLESLDRFPYTPKLKILCLNGSFCNLRGLPRCMPSLQILYVWCTSLTSLEGFPETPKLEELALTSSITSMRGLPSVFPTLTVFAVCDQGSPRLKLSGSTRSFRGLPESLMNLLELHLYSCTNLESIEGLPRMPLLQRLSCSDTRGPIFDELVARLRTDSPQLSVSG